MEGKNTSFIPACFYFLAEKQAVTHMVCKSLLLESNFLPTCDFILTFHSVFIKFYTFLLFRISTPLLAMA